MSTFADTFKVRTPRPILSEQDKKAIHEAALDVMATVGVRVHSSIARASLKKAGANVDETTHVVKFQQDLTKKLISTVPSKIVLAGRDKAFDLPMDGSHHYYTTDGTGITVWDEKTQSRRLSVLDDIRKTATIADWLPYLSIYEPMVVASDVSEKVHVIKGMKEAFEVSRKHIESESTSTKEEAKLQIRMASEIVGGIEELKKRHIISAMVCTMSPLTLDEHATDAGMVWSEAHVPVHVTGMAMMGISGPATIPGDLVVNHAETLAMAASMQAHTPGSPVIYGSVLSSMDPKTGAYTAGSPESVLLGCCSHEMAKFVNMPSSCGGIGPSTRIPGVQASLENAMLSVMSASVAAEIMNGLGLVDGSTMLSYEQLMIDNEIAGRSISINREIPVNKETLHLDLIKETGILGMGAKKGNFLGSMATMMEARKFFQSTLFNTEPYDQWEAKGKKSDMQVAKEKADWVLKNHQPVHLDKDISKRLDQIIKEAAK